MDLATFALLNKPVSELGLSRSTLDALEDAGVHDIGSLLDQEWALYPEAMADEIRRAAIARGLIAGSTEPEPKLPPEALAEREWHRIAGDDGERVRISHTDPEMPPDLERVAQSEGYLRLEDVWVEHWASSGGADSDFRPWLDLLAKAPPSRLRELELGTWGGASDFARLGPVAPTVGALPALRSLFLSGEMDTVAPFASEQLESFQVESGKWSSTPMKRFVQGTSFRHLKTFVATAESGDTRSLARLWSLPALRTVELSLFTLHPEFFELPDATAIIEMNLEQCRWPLDDEAIVEAIAAAAPRLKDVSLWLPTDAQDAAGRFEAVGLRCEYGE